MDQLGQRKKFHIVHIFIHPSPPPPHSTPAPLRKRYQQNALVNHTHLLFALILLIFLVKNLGYIQVLTNKDNSFSLREQLPISPHFVKVCLI
jgi:hypothetical protein